MTPILFYGVPSGCSFGSIVALEWLNIPYRLCRIEMPEQASSAEYKKINPAAETPSLMSAEGLMISESMAILGHLSQYGTEAKLSFRQGSQGFDRLNQMLAFLNTTFFNAYSPLWYALEHSMPEQQQQALVSYGRQSVQHAHSLLEQMLGDKTYLLGNSKTLADAYFIGIVRWNHYHQAVDLQHYPALFRLYQRLEADPAVQFAHAIEQQKTAVSVGAFVEQLALTEAIQLYFQQVI